MSANQLIIIQTLLACSLCGGTCKEEWGNRVVTAEKELATNLTAVIANADYKLFSALFDEIADVATDSSRKADAESVGRVQKLQVKLLEAICAAREWPTPLKAHAPDRKKMPPLSREGVDALGEFRDRYEEIPDPTVRAEVLAFWQAYSPKQENYLAKSKLENLRVVLEQQISFHLSEKGRLGNQYRASFKNTVSNVVVNPELVKHLATLYESSDLEKGKGGNTR
jgi:hypothetical protein